MKIAIAQITPELGNKQKNLKKIKDAAYKAASDLVVFPEMATTGYMLTKQELKKLAETTEGETVSELKKIACENNCILVVGMPEKLNNKIFNTSVIIGPKGLITKHQKTHLFLKEKLYFSPGETNPTIFECQKVKIGIGICYDYMFPEYWRNLALRGAQIFINPANFVFQYGFYMMKARAIENGIFSICVNRVGKERGQKFFGGSEAVDNRGNIIYKAKDKEIVKTLTIDPKKSKDKRWNKYNDLFLDRRTDIY